MNANELRAEVIRKGKSVGELCTAMGISMTSWFRKIKGDSEFTQNEIRIIRHELQLDDTQTASIFFNDEVS